MINLLHFARERTRARRAESGDGRAVQTPTADYSDEVVKMVEDRGGRVLWTGRPEHVLIGDAEGDGWDLVALVSYPSRSAFIDMVTSPTYERAHTQPRAWPRPHGPARVRAALGGLGPRSAKAASGG